MNVSCVDAADHGGQEGMTVLYVRLWSLRCRVEKSTENVFCVLAPTAMWRRSPSGSRDWSRHLVAAAGHGWRDEEHQQDTQPMVWGREYQRSESGSARIQERAARDRSQPLTARAMSIARSSAHRLRSSVGISRLCRSIMVGRLSCSSTRLQAGCRSASDEPTA